MNAATSPVGFRRSTWLCLMVTAIPAANLVAAPPATVQYETHVAPIFKKHCVACHNPQSMKAELDLTTPAAIFRGGESGRVIDPEDHEQSLLVEMVDEKLMPPEGKPGLSAKEIHTISHWVTTGTPFKAKIDIQKLLAAGEVNQHDIQPLMQLRCTVCHGLRKQEGGLDLRTRTSMLKGGKSGPAITLGKPAESLVLKKIHAGEMPPNKLLIQAGVKRMGKADIELLTRWIELGAPESNIVRDVATTQQDPLVNDEDRQFWSFQQLSQVTVPANKSAEAVINPIDNFVLRTLQKKMMTFSPSADRLTLMRRAYFDLTGLPPRAEEVKQFLADQDPLAYEKLIDRLLASPRYGERWGRFWLDLAGYADSEGKRSADPLRPFAYRYRDYVIRAFNKDKPYDRMLLEQLAGDELADYENAKVITTELEDNLIATGFLRMAPDGTGSDIVNFVPERMEVIADEIDIFGSTVMGLTLKCARCHSHKYDPIPQRDYYRLMDIFKGAYDVHDWLKPAFVPGQTKVKKPGRVLEVASQQTRQRVTEHNQRLDQRIKEQNQPLETLARELQKQHLSAQLKQLPAAIRADMQAAMQTGKDDRSEVQQYLVDKFGKQLTLTEKQLQQNKDYKNLEKKVTPAVKALMAQQRQVPAIRALWDRGDPSPTYIYRRGDYQQTGRLVGPGVPSALTDGKTPFQATPPWPGAKQTGRRLALAKWLVNPEHPLTARVMVNRIWKHHFGEGIVRSLDNFGELGTRPTHPQLLDWLASEFIEYGWSIKQMHRLMMTSRTYRQNSQVSEQLARLDPENRWISRMPLRRLDAEEVRDTLIHLGGKLNESHFGQPDPVNVAKDGLVTAIAQQGAWRRSIYLRQRRKEMPTLLETFDLPQMNPACQIRSNSTVPQQALYLMNNDTIRQLSASFARRVAAEATDMEEQIQWIYQTALSRPATAGELELGRNVLTDLEEKWSEHLKNEKKSTLDAPQMALKTYCHTIMNSAAFLYID
ncbi:MAG: PSD1 and planctomycete cytochrome C domain-containing protein [Pirellulaceae bacterium]